MLYNSIVYSELDHYSIFLMGFTNGRPKAVQLSNVRGVEWYGALQAVHSDLVWHPLKSTGEQETHNMGIRNRKLARTCDVVDAGHDQRPRTKA